MQIQAYRRTAKTPVNLFGLDIEFIPNSAGHCVAEVEDERAVERLLSIADAYREYTGQGVAAPAPAVPVAAPVAAPAPAPAPAPEGDDDGDKVFDEVLLGSEALPASFDVGGIEFSQAQVVSLAFERSRMNREEWNLNDEDDREALIEGEVTKLILAVDEANAAKLRADEQAAEAKRLADAQATQDQDVPPAQDKADADPLVITNDAGETLDLNTFSAKALHEFAAANKITLPKGNSVKVGELRLMVAKALTGA